MPTTPLTYAPTPRPRGRIPLILLAIAAASILVYTLHRSAPPTLSPQVQSSPPSPTTQPDDATARLFTAEIAPLLDAFDQRNRLAAAHAVADIRERLDGRRWGIKPFVKEVNSWGTRFRVVGRKTSDLWAHYVRDKPDPQSVKDLIDAKFRHHVLSEPALEQDMARSFAAFREELDASRNKLYLDLRLPLARLKTAPLTTPAGFDTFRRQVEELAARRAQELGQEFAGDSVVTGLNSLVLGTLATEVTHRVVANVVTGLLARAGTQMAAEGIAAGGATAAGAAGGGGGGSLAGPAGTVIGAAVGIGVGVAVDWWMSKRFEEKMTAQLNTFFDTLTTHLLDGRDNDNKGLKAELNAAVDRANKAQRDAVWNALHQEVSWAP
jgi:hypothetical protein